MPETEIYETREGTQLRGILNIPRRQRGKKTTFLLLFVHEGKKWQTKHKYLASLLSCVDRFKERTGEIFHDTNV